MTSARFCKCYPPLLSALSDRPDDVSICQTPPPPFQSDIRFSKNPLALYSTLTETINVYFIELKTERCQVNFMCNYNHLIKIILEIGPLADVSKAETPSPLSATVSILKHLPPSAADVICERSLIRVYICDPFRETNPPLVCILY